MKRGLVLVLGCALLSGVVGCSGADTSDATSVPTKTAAAGGTSVAATTDGNAPGIPELHGDIKTTATGLRYLDEKVGDGASPQPGQQVQVQYTGWLVNGTKFDSSRDRGQPFSFAIGQRQVIAGWDEGLLTMKVGGKRRLIIPANLGYGSVARAPIPANSVLIFDVELIAVR